MASTIPQRAELVKLCSSRDWSKAIRVLDSLISQSYVIQDICNRAFCYSQLELHKHVIKDCDRALQIDPTLLQAYILKGRALSALRRKEEAVIVWEKGYEHAVSQSTDLKQLLELEELLKVEKQSTSIPRENHLSTNSTVIPSSESEHLSSNNSSQTLNNHEKENNGTHDNNGSTKHHKSNEKHKDCVKFVSQPNGTHEKQSNGHILSEGSANASEVCSNSHETTKSCDKSPVFSSKSNDINQTPSKSSGTSDTTIGFLDEARKNKRFSVTRISKAKSINVDFRLSRGIAQVNEGKYAHAVSIFDKILQEDPTYPEALIGRGTAFAFKRELDSAISDFTKAIEYNPSAGEAWKRRGQARAALGESIEAIADLTKALEFEPNSADILHERGIVNFKFKDYNGAVKDLSACVKFDKDNKSAYTYLGLALTSIGEYKKAEEAHMKSIQLDQSFLEGWAHLTQFYQDLANSEKALECLNKILQIDGRFAKAYHLRGLLLHGMGEHRNAIKDLNIGLSLENSNIECLYLRASCHHAIGEYRDAVKDYDAALDLELDSMEKFVLQCLAFYQKELALYTASKITSEFSWFDIDGDIDPLFKEYWCKRLHPKNVCEKVYRQPPLRDSFKKGKLKKQDFNFTKQKTALLQAADFLGKRIQYYCPGFLPNRRQHRMAGLAAIEIAQKVSKAWRSLQSEWKHSNNKNTPKHGKRARRKENFVVSSQNRGGAGCSTSSSSSEPSTVFGFSDDRTLSSGRPMMSWNTVYNFAVKWRQISEPCDQVVWVNKLSEEFNAGFGSHTPLVIGQAKIVRYYPNFQRALSVAKTVIKEKRCVYSKEDNVIDLSQGGKIQEVLKAESCADLYAAIGQDFYLATWCNSTAFEGRRLEGTRIQLLKMKESGYDFAIRTPCTPARWSDFDNEMSLAWEALCNAYCGENYGSTDFDVLEKVRDAILRMTFYWYNFMPLSRGTAAVGFTVLLGLFLAANMEFTGSIPQGVQVDWEAILNSDPDSFIDSVKNWLYPSLKMTTSWKDYPDVSTQFETTGSVIAALSIFSN